MENKKDKYKGHNNWEEGIAYRRFFEDNYFHTFFFKKTEKIVSAIYLITSYVPETEPLRVHLREKSLELLSDSLSLKVQSQKIKPDAIENVIAIIFETIALVEIGHSSGYISEMNFSILKNECANLANSLEKKGSEIKRDGVYISSDLLAVPDLHLIPTLRRNNVEVGEGMFKKPLEKGIKSSRSLKITESDYNYNNIEQRLKPMKAKQSYRRNQILKFLDKKDKLTVKDISEIISDCSEKTLQRELASLVAEGVLKKEGEKRWSSYSRT